MLAAFTHSFPLVQRLASRTETELNEEFLRAWWPPALGAAPAGREAVALQRLVVHCQTAADQSLLLETWRGLPHTPRQTLEVEMARTGVSGQCYSSRRDQQSVDGYGPALLVYYAPAYLRGSLHAEPTAALLILAEVYRAGPISIYSAYNPPTPHSSCHSPHTLHSSCP